MQAGYFQTAWSDIKNSPNWFGKMCLLALISFIPIFGPIVVYGYAFGWARDIAWSIHAPMPARIFGNEDGKLYSRGFFAILIGLVFSIPSLLFYSGYVGAASSGNAGVAAFLLGLISFALAVAGMFFSWVGIMRMSIYGRLSPGFQVKQIWKMIQHDAGGLGRILGMVILVGFIVSMILSFVILAVVLLSGAGIAVQFAASGFDSALIMRNPEQLAALAPSFGLMLVFLLIASYFMQVASMFIQLLNARALGYWTRQFDVPSWCGQDAPLPFETRAAAAGGASGYGMGAQADARYSQPQQATGYQAQPQSGYQQGGEVPLAGQPYAQQGSYYQQPQDASGSYAAPASQAPEWITQANATAPEPQADPYSAAASPAAQPFTQAQPVQAQPFSAAPATAPVAAPVAAPAAAPADAQPAAAPADAQPIATPQAQHAATSQAQHARTDMHHKLEAKPAPRWEKIDLDGQSAAQPFIEAQPVQAQPFSTAPAAAPADAQPAAAPADAQPAAAPQPQHARTDMHHKLEAKPAPRWEKIDIDGL